MTTMNDAPLSPDEDLPEGLDESLDEGIIGCAAEGAIDDSSSSDSDSEPALATMPAVASGPSAAEMAAERAAEMAAEAAAALEAVLDQRDPALQGRCVLVVGLGESGLAMARWATLCGAHVTVADSRQAPPQLASLSSACPKARFIGGTLEPSLLEGVTLLAWSQGLSPTIGAAAALHEAAAAAGIAIWGELELFAREIARLRAAGDTAKVIAITGTNGKTTTTRLVGHLCRQAGRKVAVAGNISPAALDALREAIEARELPQVWVLELASYQLALADSFVPDCATVLNLTQDHLDWHPDMAGYLAAKQRIYAKGSLWIFNRDDPLTFPGATLDAPVLLPAPVMTKAAAAAAARAAAAEPVQPRVSFGLDAPRLAGDLGLVQDGGLVWLAEAVADDVPPTRRRRDADMPARVRRLMPADALRIRGTHNQANALAAIALARAAGIPMAAMLHGLRSYAGEPHRCEPVLMRHDIEWFDDSKGTNVGASVAALAGIGKRCVLIAGGDGKGQDFAPLANAVAQHAAAVLLIGRDAPLIRQALADTGVLLEDCASLEEAVDRAGALARPGQAVLLSPACASFDMFRNYGHRAQVFVDAVHRLAQAEGQPC
jgi:UDP-N-acetylmuramoylalanine--D-glutamate ligase